LRLGTSVWDIDAFTMTTGGKVVALEVKQKYPTRKNTYGLNDGQGELFTFLTGIGMPVVHVILRKPVDDPTLSAIDLMTLPEYRERTSWYFTRFKPGSLQQAIEKAPPPTSITANKPLPYSHIRSEFRLLKGLGVNVPDLRKLLLEGIE